MGSAESVRSPKIVSRCHGEGWQRRGATAARGRYHTAPPWLPALAESVGGRRFNAQGITEAVPIAELMPFKKRFTETPATDFHTRWAQWFFADRATRPPSPQAPAESAK